jgi:predicted Zn-dependent peptidase
VNDSAPHREPFAHRLDNGLRIIGEQRASMRSVAIACVVGAGSRHDDEQHPGLAHVVEHLLFEAGDIERADHPVQLIDDLGGEFNASTHVDQTLFWAYVPTEDLATALAVLAGVITRFNPTPKQVYLAKRVIAQELEQFGQDNRFAYQRIKFGLMGADETLKHAVTGTQKSVQRMNIEDARRFYETHYVGERTVLCLVGNLGEIDVAERVAEHFGGMSTGGFELADASETEPRQAPKRPAKGPRVRALGVRRSGTLALFLRWPDEFADRPEMLVVANEFFAAGPASRLFSRLRIRDGLVYQVGSEVSLSGTLNSLDVHAVTSERSQQQVAEAIIDEAGQLRRHPPNVEQFERIRARLLKRNVLAHENPIHAACWHAWNALRSPAEGAGSLDEWNERLGSLRHEDLLAALPKLLDPVNWFLCATGRLSWWRRWRLKRRIKALRKVTPPPATVGRPSPDHATATDAGST